MPVRRTRPGVEEELSNAPHSCSRQYSRREAVQFYTQQKVISTRWFGEGVGDVWKK